MRQRRILLVLAGGLLLWLGWHSTRGGDHLTGPAAAPTSAAPGTAAPGTGGTTGGTTGTTGGEPTGPTPPGPTTSAAPPAAGTTPDVVGKRLSEALLALATAGYPLIEPVDASGLGRVVINPENWVVRTQQPAAGTAAAPSTRITLRVAKPTDPAAGAGAAAPEAPAGTVPQVVCRDLQAAKETLGAAGFDQVRSQDGLGRHRTQLVDQNWIVIAQSAPAGSRPGSSTSIVLTVVKYGEPTGSSGCRS